MKKKNIITIIIITLVIILAASYIFNMENQKHEINNTTHNNTTNIEKNQTKDKNISINNNSSIDKNMSVNNNSNIDKDLNKDYRTSLSSNDYKANNKEKSNESYDEAMEAKLGVEKYVLNKNEIAGYPIYKDPHLDSWLVPIFDKKTKKFLGSVYIYKGGKAFVLGPQSYSDYKEIVYGKTTHKSNSSEKVLSKISNSNKTQKIDVIGKSNPDVTNDLNSINDNPENINFDNGYITMDLNPTLPIIESDDVSNSTT